MADKKVNNPHCARKLRPLFRDRPRFEAAREAQKTAAAGQILYTGFGAAIAAIKEAFMAETVVKLRLNQQQLELIDRTIAQGIAPDRVSLVRLALREYAAARKAEASR
jgi:hypothetical protein